MVSVLSLEANRGHLAGSSQMGIDMLIGKNAAFSITSLLDMHRMSNFSTNIGLEESTCKVQQVSRRRYKVAQSLHRLSSRVPGVECGRRGRIVYYGLRCEILHRFPRGKRYEGQGKSQRPNRGHEGILAAHNGDQEVSVEQSIAASEEIEAEDARLQLSPNASSGHERIFIFGFGYTSCALARYLKNIWCLGTYVLCKQGRDSEDVSVCVWASSSSTCLHIWNFVPFSRKVSGTCRSEEKKEALEDCGYSAHVFNSDNDGEELRDEGLRELQHATHWLISLPPVADFDSDPVLTRHAQDLKQAVAIGNVHWVGYLSSTGVYGDWQGNWVDEESDPRPVGQKALARLAAEKSWLNFGLNHGVPVHVFRLGGIYGPGRSAINTVLQTQKLSKRQQIREQRRFTSRIHVDDISQTVLASMQNPDSGKTYNVVDDDPASRMEVLSYAQDLLNNQDTNPHKVLIKNMVASPNIVLSGSTSSNRAGEKRVSNKRIKLDLQVKLLYPTYKEGLKAILKAINEGKN